jgi:glyoxylase-like metal-dependent hydrolase (beta-lactamase superfamily II)
MINYYEKQHLIVIDTKKVIYKKQMFCNDVSSNCYIFISNGEAVMIDAGIKLDEILMCLGKLNVKLKYILITHGYIDHIFSACEIKNSTGAKIVFSNNDIITIEKNYSKDFSVKDVDKFVDNHDVLKLNGVEIKVIEAPGHTIGSVCYKIDQYLFTGDTLLKSKVGISDDGRFYTKTIDSIKTKLFPLEDQMIIDSQKLEY